MRRKKLPEGAFKAEVTGLSHEGRGIAKVEGKTTFISFALPGETVQFEYSNRKSNYDEGMAVEVLEASNLRANPPCEYFKLCGGCSFQHVSPNEQIKLKEETLLNHYQHFGQGIQPEKVLKPLVSDNTEHYRTKARLGVRYVHKKGKVLVGFRERNGRFLAEIDHCKVLDKSVGTDLRILQELIISLESYKEIPQIEVAVDDQRTALIIRHLVDLSPSDLEKISCFAKAHGFWIYLQSKGPDTIKRLYPDANETPKQLSYRLDEFDVQINFEPNDFTQVNREINHKMINQALNLLEVSPSDTVLDLFCGLGNFSLPLARKAKYVVGVEGDEAMTKRAGENAQQNSIDNVAFHAANLFEDISKHSWIHEMRFDKLLLDPPRAGAEKLCSQMDLIQPKRIVYVSCDPSTLARDAGILVKEKGYKLVSSGVMDMFPHTTHVESIAVFEK
ncbi:23S rRNA (uracil(1939)-C(5))-methyltransferase RlmD [Fangia hongkongensis]|uniref:23S rRNA (uracil(1939)-C(5))-methyltransferase RlmD n=1 Tax=Fangia hongkongensis TaxID=270495 RepID=UPI00036BF767|nr:23S rRNA (uracil(1939)-C(5))-methyltransferase RlmD [Fangia hongkongensis]MBK2125592.1 23S rRNA (uracil(1939)-C(5))-methyltransferase RlmD [Fangia hongkongensis]